MDELKYGESRDEYKEHKQGLVLTMAYCAAVIGVFWNMTGLGLRELLEAFVFSFFLFFLYTFYGIYVLKSEKYEDRPFSKRETAERIRRLEKKVFKEKK